MLGLWEQGQTKIEKLQNEIQEINSNNKEKHAMRRISEIKLS